MQDSLPDIAGAWLPLWHLACSLLKLFYSARYHPWLNHRVQRDWIDSSFLHAQNNHPGHLTRTFFAKLFSEAKNSLKPSHKLNWRIATSCKRWTRRAIGGEAWKKLTNKTRPATNSSSPSVTQWHYLTQRSELEANQIMHGLIFVLSVHCNDCNDCLKCIVLNIKFAITDIIFHRRLKCINAWLLAEVIQRHNFSTATLCLHDHYYHSKVGRVDRTVKWLTSSPILCRHAGWHQIVNDIRGISKSIRHFIRQFIRHLTTLSVSLSVTWPLYPSVDHFAGVWIWLIILTWFDQQNDHGQAIDLFSESG